MEKLSELKEEITGCQVEMEQAPMEKGQSEVEVDEGRDEGREEKGAEVLDSEVRKEVAFVRLADAKFLISQECLALR